MQEQVEFVWGFFCFFVCLFVFFCLFFTSQQPLRAADCYEGSGPEVYTLNVIIQL